MIRFVFHVMKSQFRARPRVSSYGRDEPGGTPVLGHESHEIVVAVLAGIIVKIRPRGLDHLISTAKPGQQLAVKSGEIAAGHGAAMRILPLECDPDRKSTR